MYNCILADPGWSYGDDLEMSSVKRGSASQYDCMSVSDICGMGVKQDGQQVIRMLGDDYNIADTALLWLWVTNPFLIDGSGTSVCRAWGFEPKTLVTWLKADLGALRTVPKIHFGMGRYTRGCTEHLIIAARGEATSLITDHSQRNLLIEPARAHSQKPDATYALIEKVQGYKPARNLILYGDDSTRRLELFARQRREGWTSVGNELGRQP